MLTLVVTAHRAAFLAEALASVADQTSSEFELVCCADTTGEIGVPPIFASFVEQSRGGRGTLIRVDGGTAGRVRNAGFAATRTDWVAYLDGDDVLHREAVAGVLEVIRAGNADLVSTGMARIDALGDWTPLTDSLTYRPPLWIYKTDPDTVGHPTYFNQFLAMRRRLWEWYRFDEKTNGEDIDFMLHQLLVGRFVKVPRALYGYRDTPDSFSKRMYDAGDLCTHRYRAGYYQRLFAERFQTHLAGNFLEAPTDP